MIYRFEILSIRNNHQQQENNPKPGSIVVLDVCGKFDSRFLHGLEKKILKTPQVRKPIF